MVIGTLPLYLVRLHGSCELFVFFYLSLKCYRLLQNFTSLKTGFACWLLFLWVFRRHNKAMLYLRPFLSQWERAGISIEKVKYFMLITHLIYLESDDTMKKDTVTGNFLENSVRV